MKSALGALSVACLFVASDALAASHRAAVIDGDAALVEALDAALSPWGVEVDSHAVVGPGATMPMATDRARALAHDTRADVVIWISSANGAYALWVYDAESDHASARSVPGAPPFDEPTAAAIALSIKTILRTTKVAPPQERFGAVARDDTTWQLDIPAGVALRSGTPSAVEPRAGIGLSVWPAAFAHRVGLTLGAESGTGIHVDGDRFTATIIDVSLRLAIAARWRFAPSVALEAELGGAAHVLFVDGFVVTDRASASLRRVDPAIEPRVALDFAAAGGRVRVAPWIGVAYLTRSQELLVHGAQVTDLAPLVTQAGLRLSVGIE